MKCLTEKKAVSEHKFCEQKVFCVSEKLWYNYFLATFDLITDKLLTNLH